MASIWHPSDWKTTADERAWLDIEDPDLRPRLRDRVIPSTIIVGVIGLVVVGVVTVVAWAIGVLASVVG